MNVLHVSIGAPKTIPELPSNREYHQQLTRMRIAAASYMSRLSTSTKLAFGHLLHAESHERVPF